MISKIGEWLCISTFLAGIAYILLNIVPKIYLRFCCDVYPEAIDVIPMAIVMIALFVGILFMFIQGLVLTINKIKEWV